MSDTDKLPIAKKHRPIPKHVSTTPYVVGFVLSLIFTLVPYYMVVHKSFTARAILAWIIGFAFLQMAIQLIFFLHLGREKKPHFNLFFLTSTGGIILLVVVGSIWIMSHLTHDMSAMDVANKVALGEAVHQIDGNKTGTCPGTPGTDHMVMLMNNVLSPAHVDAHLCDTLTIMNMDATTRHLDFGAPGKNETYAGDTSQTAYGNHNLVITLTELGTHQYHDHLLDKLAGEFTVTQ